MSAPSTTSSEALPRRPLAVTSIVVLAWLRLAAFAALVIGAIWSLSPPRTEWQQGFRRGWLRQAGFDPESYGPEQAGELFGRALVPAILAVLLLVFVRTRKLTAVRVTGIVLLFFALSQPISLLLSIVLVVLTFVPSTRHYFAAAMPASGETVTRTP